MTQAADLGNVVATTNLAVIYKNGINVKKDYTKAIYWAKRPISLMIQNRSQSCLKSMMREK